MNKKLKIILIICLIAVMSIMSYGIYYINDYYHADKCVNQYLNGNENVSVIKTSNALFLNGTGDEEVIIFYPGAKVEYTAYIPLFMNLSNQGIDCFIIKMPANMAFLGINSANEIINNNSFNYTSYYISGHSLGGAMASVYANENQDKVNGLILLASYPIVDVKNSSTLLIYGSNDNILNKNQYDENKKFLPNNYTEYIIQGGNHAQYAYYGIQSGDGKANITTNNQIKETVDEIISFMRIR